MLEIEAKMRLGDRASLLEALEREGAPLAARFLEHNRFYDLPDRSLRQTDRGLRCRVLHELDTGRVTTVLTHKGPRQPGAFKSRPEHELTVTDGPDAAHDFLTAMGYELTLGFEKRRDRYRLAGCLVELDSLPRIGAFVEIEGPDENTIESVRTRLGLRHEPLLTASYAAMLHEALGDAAKLDIKLEN